MIEQQSDRRNHLLLITANAQSSRSGAQSEHVIFGACYRATATSTIVPDLVFQCAPLHRCFHGVESISHVNSAGTGAFHTSLHESFALCGCNSRGHEIGILMKSLYDKWALVKEYDGASITTWRFQIDDLLLVEFEGRTKAPDAWIH